MKFTTNPEVYTCTTTYEGLPMLNCGLSSTADLYDAEEVLWGAFNCAVCFGLN